VVPACCGSDTKELVELGQRCPLDHHPPFSRRLVHLALLPLEAGTKEIRFLMKPNRRPTFWHLTRRRPSFWLGLFVACFLAWAWQDSTRHMFEVSATVAGKGSVVMRRHGSTWILYGLSDGGFWVNRRPDVMPDDEWKEYLSSWVGVGFRQTRVPDSLVFFSYVGLWIGWLTFSDWRRKTRTADLRVASPSA